MASPGQTPDLAADALPPAGERSTLCRAFQGMMDGLNDDARNDTITPESGRRPR